ncbi:hypothetical protein SERLADRAFT_404851 [Serpula lacrymans var. lacrymans S7.9]|uniref:Uncharacterized protein n=1 Tax=Serpula lacrymans var. lacrymans (strain S7.9) TaxID=578457 RepID=F8NFM6_SERL9|nr:uncharacterized protein SERLADRAFT_404851 [Serpula lacrymans var. lacrymans S7.9]EGO30866.1 hypothetical protein SERLADRAFT_404851 [Serpula lacrymans var. lacrymans S7.9]
MWEVCWAEEACQCDLMQCYISEEDLKFQVLRLIAVITELSAHNENTPSAHQVRVILSVVTVDSVPSALYPAKEVAIFNKAAAFFAPNTQGLVPGQIVTGKEITFKNVEYLEPHSILKKLGRKDTLSIRYYWDVISKILIMFGPPSSIHKASTEHLCNCFLKAMGVQDASVGTDNISNPMSMWDYFGNIWLMLRIPQAGQLLPQERNLAAVNKALQEAWCAMVDKVYPGLVPVPFSVNWQFFKEALNKGVIINAYLCYTSWYTEHKRGRYEGNNTESGGLGTDAAGNSSGNNANDGG